MDRSLQPVAWLADGRIVYLSSPDLTSSEIKFLEPGERTGRTVVSLGFAVDGAVSHDGRWLAYTSREPSQRPHDEIIVQPFPGPGERTQVATAAQNPAWSADGRTLYYLSVPGTSSMFAVDVATAGRLTVGPPHEVLTIPAGIPGQGCVPARCFDVAADGQRFLIRDLGAGKRESASRIDLIVNWTATLNAR
jgi:hypothetical protein